MAQELAKSVTVGYVFKKHQLKILALNEELQTVGGKQYTDVSASNYSKFNFEFDD